MPKLVHAQGDPAGVYSINAEYIYGPRPAMGKRDSIDGRHKFARARARDGRDGTGRLVLNGSPRTPGSADYSVLDLADTTRLALLVTARAQGDYRQQAAEVLEVMRAV